MELQHVAGMADSKVKSRTSSFFDVIGVAVSIEVSVVLTRKCLCALKIW